MTRIHYINQLLAEAIGKMQTASAACDQFITPGEELALSKAQMTMTEYRAVLEKTKKHIDALVTVADGGPYDAYAHHINVGDHSYKAYRV